MKAITKNAARCKKCGEVVESDHVYAFVQCSCGKIAVDGGHEYLRRIGSRDDFDELSEWASSDDDEEES